MPKGNEAVCQEGSYPYIRFTFSIADFIEYVNSEFLTSKSFLG